MEQRSSLSKIVRPLSKGQITIPVEFRRKLGISENTLLAVTLSGEKIEITPVKVGPSEELRRYAEAEIERFMAEDKLDPETAERVRHLLGEGTL